MKLGDPRLWLGFPLIAIAGIAQALQSDSNQPIHVKADSAQLNDSTGVSVYRGQVEVTQGSIVLNADTVRIIAPQHAVERIEAEGNLATYRQKTDDGKEIYGEGEYLQFTEADNKLILLRRAKLLDGDNNTFASARIEYNRDSRVVEAGDPKTRGRVDMTIVPRPKPPEAVGAKPQAKTGTAAPPPAAAPPKPAQPTGGASNPNAGNRR